MIRREQRTLVVTGVIVGLVAVAVSVWWLCPFEESVSHAGPTSLQLSGLDQRRNWQDSGSLTEAPLQERALVTPDVSFGTSKAEDNKGPAEPQIDGQFERELNRIAQSFLTETPDFPALAAFWDQVGKDATVVADSVKHEGSQTTGELAFPNSNVRARFEIQNDRYRIEFASPTSREDDTAFVQQSVTVTFRGENGIANPGASIVQYHPDTRKQAAEELKGGQELLIGWEVSRPDGRAQATPLAAWLADGGRWAIGKSERRSRVEAIYGVDGRAEQALLQTLSFGSH